MTRWASIGPAQWRDDLAHLDAALRREHRNLFHRLSPEAWNEAVRALHARIPSLVSHEAVCEFARLVAAVGDGHTALRLTDVPDLGRIPLSIERFHDGIHVQSITAEHAAAVGSRLLAINGTPAKEAWQAVRPLISRDNEMGVWAAAPGLLATPAVLHARGLSHDPDHARFEIQPPSGRRTTLLLRRVDGTPSAMVDARDAAAAPPPPWLRRSAEENGIDLLPDSGTLCFAYNRVRDAPGEPLTALFDRVFDQIGRHQAARLVIDIRLNHGGNNSLNLPLVHHLIRCDRVNQWGQLFVVIGRRTFSAAMNLAVDLERHTRALFVGEPTGSSPNHYGENAEFHLPHSGLRVSASALWWQHSLPYDDRPWITPDLPAQLGSQDYATNLDPALAAILAHRLGSPLPRRYPDRLLHQLRRSDLLTQTDRPISH